MNFPVLRWPTKDPSDVLDYSFDVNEFLMLSTPPDTIAGVVWLVPAGLTAGAQYHAAGVATIWLSGGAAGETYTLTATVTTAAGRVVERSLVLPVREL
jgi:hypothetical protein